MTSIERALPAAQRQRAKESRVLALVGLASSVVTIYLILYQDFHAAIAIPATLAVIVGTIDLLWIRAHPAAAAHTEKPQ